MATSNRIIRIGVTALLTDLSIYVIWVAIPYKAISLGADAIYLGLLPTVSSIAYVLTTLLAGPLSDRVSRLQLARFGALCFAVGSLLVMQARSLGALIALLPLTTLGVGFFWPPIQAALADEGDLSRLQGNVGLFNIFWSVGKALGFIVGGVLYAWFGAAPSFVVAAGLMLLVAAVLPTARPVPQGIEPEPAHVYRDVPARQLKTFLYMAWIANAVAFGIGNTLNIQYPKFLLQLGRGSDAFGIYLGAIFVVQTITFVILRQSVGWRFRWLPSFAAQAAAGLVFCLIPFLRAFGLLLVTAIPIGVALGFAYHASITYSLIDRTSRGRRAGIHESLLGLGNFLLPLLGGLLASGTADLRMPYWLCGFVIFSAIIVQHALWRRGRADRDG